MNIETMFRPSMNDWATPRWLFEALHAEFGFTLDPCCDDGNATCAQHFTLLDDGLSMDWGTECAFMNPPCSACGEWIAKAFAAASRGATVVCLMPSRTDTDWWHRYAMQGEIRFLKGRLKLGPSGRVAAPTITAPFASAVVIFRPPDFRLYQYDKT